MLKDGTGSTLADDYDDDDSLHNCSWGSKTKMAAMDWQRILDNWITGYLTTLYQLQWLYGDQLYKREIAFHKFGGLTRKHPWPNFRYYPSIPL
jgi:hypothetical protein